MPAAGEKLRVWGVFKGGTLLKQYHFCPPQAENFEVLGHSKGESLRFLYAQYKILTHQPQGV